MSYKEHLVAESASWLIEDQDQRREKFRRERIRHHRLLRDLLLHRLDTDSMDILEIGGGPQPLSDLLKFASRKIVDPLTEDYAKVIPTPDHVVGFGEDIKETEAYDLVITTNSLDHVRVPRLVVENMARALRPGGYMAIMCAEHNAFTNPHPAHEHNLDAAQLHRWLDDEFETVWELNYRDTGYRYGWVLWDGKRGQPAFALLLRKCSGYSS